MNGIRVLFLGPARDFARTEEMELPLPAPATIGALRIMLAGRYPALAPGLATMRFAINLNYANDDGELHAGDEVALIPPVSGGSGESRTWVELLREPLPVDRVRAFVSGDEGCGGIVLFEGVTRADQDGVHGALVRLEYEAYDGMALIEMERLVGTARTRWALGAAAVVHRLGVVPLTEASVVIAVAAGHRAEAFAACRFLIDTLKCDVPIWKKDVFADGYMRWVDPTRSA